MDHRFKRTGALFLYIVLILFILNVFTACRKKEQTVLYLYNWTYYTPDSVIQAFEKKYDVKVVYDDFASNEDMFAKLMAGSKLSLIHISEPTRPIFQKSRTSATYGRMYSAESITILKCNSLYHIIWGQQVLQ